ncbi:MAG: M23 family metallopeptidase [Dehalococcoidia bacterium]|nr:M23 family metallopeptidase [Dehalococcoidia bacterium]
MADGPRQRRISRRAVLTAGLGLPLAALLGACGRNQAPPPAVVTGPPSQPPTASPSPTATDDPAPGLLEASFAPAEVGQGESTILVVRQPGAAGGSVQFLGRRYPLGAGGRGTFWAVLGVGLSAPLGEEVALVTTRSRGGEPLATLEVPFMVVTVERPVDYLVTTEEVAAILTPEAAEIEEALRTFEQFNLFQARPRWNGRMSMPVEGIITTQFGEGRSINGGPVGGFHSGVDIANASGTPILAPAAGRVAWVGAMPIRGNSVLLDHGAGVVTGYHHLLEATCQVGDLVAPGDEIARMGSTGFSTGPHLHWEMTIFGINVDPLTWTEQVFLPKA